MKSVPIVLAVILVLGLGQAILSGSLADDSAPLMTIPLALLGTAGLVAMAKLIGSTNEARRWLMRMAIGALILRLVLGTVLTVSGAGMKLGGDYDTYHLVASSLSTEWSGGPPVPDGVRRRFLGEASHKTHGSRAGFYYFVGFLYFTLGKSMFLTNVAMSLFGAASPMLVYAIGRELFSEAIGRQAALLGWFFPSIVLWTSQGYKDGLIIFCLLLAYRCTQILQDQFKPMAMTVLAGCLWGMYQIRGYIFYVAIGPILLALSNRRSSDRTAFYNQLFGILLLGLGIIGSGLGNNLLTQLQEVNLKEVNIVRSGLAQDASSGIEKERDISTPGAALAYLPTGVSYFLFAPFPWQMTKVSTLMTLPEMLIWWSLVPSMFRGIRLAVRDRIGEASSILIFLTLLTLVYGLAQGNVGTAYRVRAQLLVFYFIFAAAGLHPKHFLARILPKEGDVPSALPAPPPPPATPHVQLPRRI